MNKSPLRNTGHENSKVFKIFGISCERCDTKKSLTRHHIKDLLGRKTGEVEILCRDCHNEAEEEYIMLGIIHIKKKHKLTRNEKLQRDYRDGKLPFYSIYPKFNEILRGQGFKQ